MRKETKEEVFLGVREEMRVNKTGVEGKVQKMTGEEGPEKMTGKRNLEKITEGDDLKTR